MTKFHIEHTCPTVGTGARAPASNMHYLKEVCEEYLLTDESTTARQLCSYVTRYCGADVSYHQAYRTLCELRTKLFGTAAASYNKLASYLQAFKQKDPMAVTDFETSPDGAFYRAFMAPSAAINVFLKAGKRLVALDGTHTRGKFKHVVLSAVCLDTNGHIMPLAYALVDGESHATWAWFLLLLQRACPLISTGSVPVISDRDKGLASALRLYPRIPHAYCLQHLKRNAQSKHPGGKPMGALLWSLGAAPNVGLFEQLELKFRDKYPPAARYILGDNEVPPTCPREAWARAYFGRPRYGQLTSNICESFNKAIVKQRGELCQPLGVRYTSVH